MSRKLEAIGSTELLAIMLNKLGGAVQITQTEVDKLPSAFTVRTYMDENENLTMLVEDKGAIMQ